jgi:hypothetical protein
LFEGVIALSIWLAVTTLVTLNLIRNVGALSTRLQSLQHRSPHEDGLPIGSHVPASVKNICPKVATHTYLILLLHAEPTCTPCQRVLAALTTNDLPRTLIIMPGPPSEMREVAQSVLDSSSPQVCLVLGPSASDLQASLGLTTTPFALAVEDGIITSKRYLYSENDLLDFWQLRARTPTRSRPSTTPSK